MKFIIRIMIIACIFSFFTCDDTSSNEPELSLTITKADWSANVDEGFGTIDLDVAGYTTGEKVSIITHGDGVIRYWCLILDSDGNFDETITIAFTHAPDSEPRQYSTEVTAYASGYPYYESLINCFGSGVTKTVILESDYLTYP